MHKASRKEEVMSELTLNALIKRINRKLAHNEQVLKVLRGKRWIGDLGRYYVVDFNRNVNRTHMDPQMLGRELGVLASRESTVRPGNRLPSATPHRWYRPRIRHSGVS
jgi:hypothetical protein